MKQTLGAKSVERGVAALRMYQARESFLLMAFGALVGIFSGLAGVLLNTSVHAIEDWRHHLDNPYLLLVLPAIGALVGVFLQLRVFRDFSGHGVPDVIQSVTTGRGLLPKRMAFSRLVSSCLTVGSGGAAGLEGPIVVSGAALGSAVARWFHMPQRRRVLMIACGASGAIAGIFNAPLTGLIFSLEVILGEWKARNLVPTVTAAAVATQVSRSLMGDKIPFPRGEVIQHGTPDLPAFVLLGIICAYAGLLLTRILRLSGSWFEKTPIAPPLRAGLGGLGVGITAFFVPETMGEGYHLIDQYINNQFHGHWGLLAFLVALRFLTTALTLGSGGAGGVFAPSLFFGSSIGLLFGRFIAWLDPYQSFAVPSAYALVGMAGLVAGILSAPLTGIFLILEICGSYDLILPLMLCSLTSMLVSRYLAEGSIYTRDLIHAGTYRRRGSEIQVLADVSLSEVIEPCPLVTEDETLGDFIMKHGRDEPNVYALVDEKSRYLGLIFIEDIRPYLFDRALYPILTMASVADNSIPSLGQNATPDLAWLGFSRTKRDAIPVLDDHNQVIGVVTKASLFDSARREFSVQDEA